MNNVVTSPPTIINWIERERSLISMIIFKRRSTIDLISDCNVIIFYLNEHLYIDFYYLPVSDQTLTCGTCLCLTILLAYFSLYVDLYSVSDHILTYTTTCLYLTRVSILCKVSKYLTESEKLGCNFTHILSYSNYFSVPYSICEWHVIFVQ